MATVKEYLEPIKIIRTSNFDTYYGRVTSDYELIEITPVVFEGYPQTADFNALPDECKIERNQYDSYILCVSSDYYGTSAAAVGEALAPYYRAHDGVLYVDCGGGNSATISGGYTQYSYLCVYKTTSDSRGLRLTIFGKYSLRPGEDHFTSDWYSSNKMTPGDYVAFKEKATPTNMTYNGIETTLEIGQTAALCTSGKLMKSDVVITFGADGNITYNGTETPVTSGKTATLPCKGKVMTGDIVIKL